MNKHVLPMVHWGFSRFFMAQLRTTYTEMKTEIYIVQPILHSEYIYTQSLE